MSFSSSDGFPIYVDYTSPVKVGLYDYEHILGVRQNSLMFSSALS